MKRTCRYIKDRPRHALVHAFQVGAGELVVRTDSDWDPPVANCIGAATLFIIGVGSRLKSRPAPEKLYAQVRGPQVMLSTKCMMDELRPSGVHGLRSVTEVDSTAYKGALLRHGELDS